MEWTPVGCFINHERESAGRLLFLLHSIEFMIDRVRSIRE
jgi:hypothetical protein